MDDIYKRYVDLCLNLCLKDDYGNPRKVKRHNSSMRKLQSLQQEINGSDHSEVLMRLIQHPDDCVRLYAATFCIKNNIHSNAAINVLYTIMNDSEDSTLAFAAKMALNGKLN